MSSPAFSWLHFCAPVLDRESPLAEPRGVAWRALFERCSALVGGLDAIVCSAGVLSRSRTYFDRSLLRELRRSLTYLGRPRPYGRDPLPVALQVLPNVDDATLRVGREWPFILDPRDYEPAVCPLGEPGPYAESPFSLVAFPDDQADAWLLRMAAGEVSYGDTPLVLLSRSGDFPSRRLYPLHAPIAVCHIGDDTRRPPYERSHLPVGTTFHVDEPSTHEHIWWRGTARNRALGSILGSSLCHRDEEGNLYAWPLARLEQLPGTGYQAHAYFLEIGRVGRPVGLIETDEQIDTGRLEKLIEKHLAAEQSLTWLIELYPEVALHLEPTSSHEEVLELVRKLVPPDELLRQLSRSVWSLFNQNLAPAATPRRGTALRSSRTRSRSRPS